MHIELVICGSLSFELLRSIGQLENVTLSVAAGNVFLRELEILFFRMSAAKSPLKFRFMYRVFFGAELHISLVGFGFMFFSMKRAG